MKTIETENPEHGFYGTWGRSRKRITVKKAWETAVDLFPGSSEAARLFLDSTDGRHFANGVIDDVLNGRELSECLEAAYRMYAPRVQRCIEYANISEIDNVKVITAWTRRFEVTGALIYKKVLWAADGADVTDLCCTNCGLWIGDPDDQRIAHVSVDHDVPNCRTGAR